MDKAISKAFVGFFQEQAVQGVAIALREEFAGKFDGPTYKKGSKNLSIP